MKQVVASSSGIQVIETPAPICNSRELRIEVYYSFISTGTELTAIEQMESRTSNISQHVIENPNLVKKITERVKASGIQSTLKDIKQYISNRKSMESELIPLGYSISGKIIETGKDVTKFSVGDLVASAGSKTATHSEIVCVPENLTVHADKSELKSASSVGIGSIAMHAIHQSKLQLGEYVLIIGLGTVGTITAQLANAAGYRVIGFDTDDNKIAKALQFGFEKVSKDISEIESYIEKHTQRMGVDSSIVTAKSNDSAPLNTAISATKPRGRIVMLGEVHTEFERAAILPKEIELVPSYSYGPGRQDPLYEHFGLDYPYSYVRWTENRNMSEYLRQISNGNVNIESMVKEFSINNVSEAYNYLKTDAGDLNTLAALIKYDSNENLQSKLTETVSVKHIKHKPKSIGIAVAGAGKFSQSTHLPNLRKLNTLFHLTGILNTKGISAVELARNYNANYATTSYKEILEDNETDAILISTRPELHNKMDVDAIQADKHVLVEKPLALNYAELRDFQNSIGNESFSTIVMTGFNRRFSPLISQLHALLSNTKDPLIINYQMNVGYLNPNHWLRNSEGGGRNIGEACHIYDLFTFLTNSKISNISAYSIDHNLIAHSKNENFTANFKFEDGSVANLIFTSLGSTKFPKEQMVVYQSESAYYINDYKTLDVYNKSHQVISNKSTSKGHLEELEVFANSILTANDPPIPYWQQIQATEMALEVEDLIS